MKVAISVPDPVFDAAERLAKELKVSRSQLYSEALAAFLDSTGGAAVTAKLDAVYGSEPSAVDDAVMTAQLRMLRRETW